MRAGVGPTGTCTSLARLETAKQRLSFCFGSEDRVKTTTALLSGSQIPPRIRGGGAHGVPGLPLCPASPFANDMTGNPVKWAEAPC